MTKKNSLSVKSVSPKVIVATIAAIVVPGILASLNYLITPEGQQLFASLPPVVTVGIFAVVTGLISFLSGYLKSDPARVLTEGASGNADQKTREL